MVQINVFNQLQDQLDEAVQQIERLEDELKRKQICTGCMILEEEIKKVSQSSSEEVESYSLKINELEQYMLTVQEEKQQALERAREDYDSLKALLTQSNKQINCLQYELDQECEGCKTLSCEIGELKNEYIEVET